MEATSVSEGAGRGAYWEANSVRRERLSPSSSKSGASGGTGWGWPAAFCATRIWASIRLQWRAVQPGPPMQLPGQALISTNVLGRQPALISSRAAMQFWMPSTARYW